MDQIKETILLRQKALDRIRQYFSEQGVLEVDTPLIAQYSVTDPYMSAFSAVDPDGKRLGYLQTSPEYAMKKLLCSGSGDIFQLGKVFRANEQGPHHLCEFSMLEWYRLGMDEQDLMDEVASIIRMVAGQLPRIDYSYQAAFELFLGIDPFAIDDETLAQLAQDRLGELPQGLLRDNYLTLLFATQVEPGFAPEKLTFVYDYPASQASLARTRETNCGAVAHRFEAFAGGLELANGFWELADGKEQLARFEEDNRQRLQLGYPLIDIDNQLIDALAKGLPDCAGVAVGFDRLLVLQQACPDIRQVTLPGHL